MKRIFKKILRIIFLFLKSNFNGVSFSKQENIVWMPLLTWRFLFSDRAVYLFGVITSLSNHGIKLNIRFKKNIGDIFEKRIYLGYSRDYLVEYGFIDYAKNLHFIAQHLEHQRNQVYPGSDEIRYWENKSFMYRKFKELDISSPETEIISSRDLISNLKWEYPFLVKEEHSASAEGVHLIKSFDDLERLLRDDFFQKNENLIVQKLLNMRRDLRVILVGDKIVHHYWRINKSDEWKPTSTGQGSRVDFKNFPEQWRDFIISEFKKFNITTGAFDIAWENDDLETKPLILEVSPAYQLNPTTENKDDINSYGKYKKKLYLSKQSYDYKFINQTFSVIDKVVQESLNRQGIQK